MDINDIRKEYGEDIYAYRQEYAGARIEKDGYSDEYVHFIEQKLTSDNSDYTIQPTYSHKLPSLDEVKKYMGLDNEIKGVEVLCIYNVIKKLGNFT